MIGITHQVSFAPPVNKTSVTFIVTSMEIIEIKLIPMAVLKAKFNAIWRDKIKVSKIIDVIMPLIIARIIMPITGQAILLY
jgi:hypothetical protein